MEGRISPSCCPSLSPEQVRSLANDGIKNLMDLIVIDKSRLMTVGRLNLSEYETVRNGALEIVQPSPIRGSQLIYQLSQRKFHSTGIEGLDHLLRGGLQGAELLEVYGEMGSGKTQFCCAIAAKFLRERHSVVYFDLKGNFCAMRQLEYCEDVREQLNNIEIIQPTCFQEIMTDLDEIFAKVSKNPDSFYGNLKLMIFDSVPMIIYPAVGDFASWRFYQERFAEKVIQLSRLNGGIVIIFVNHSVTKRPNYKKSNWRRENLVVPAMGVSYWVNKPNFRILLAPIKNKQPQVFTATLKKSTRTETETKFSFSIGNYMIESF